MSVRPIWLVLAVLFLPLISAADQAYLSRLDRAERLLSQAQAHPEQAGTLVREAGALTPKGAAPSLDTASNHPTPENISRARREVVALRRMASLSPVSGGGVQADSRATMGQVLARKEFRPLQKSKTPEGWSKFWRQVRAGMVKLWHPIKQAINKLLTWLDKSLRGIRMPWGKSSKPSWWNGLANWLKITIYILLGAVVLFLIGLLVSKLISWWTRREVDDVRGELVEESPAIKRKQEPGYWDRSIQQAQDLWTQGDQREALRTVHRACLVLLDARGVLRYDDTRANGEVLRELRRQGKSKVHETLRPIIRSFDRSWYGFLDVSQDEFAAVLSTTRSFREAVVGDT